VNTTAKATFSMARYRVEDLEKSAATDQAQPSRRMTLSMTQDIELGQSLPLANASAPSLLKRITRSRAQALGVEH